jgi:hypothetical protein
MDRIKVENEDNLYRDFNTGAIINTDKSAFERYKRSKQKYNNLELEVTSLKSELSEIKLLLKELLKSNGT